MKLIVLAPEDDNHTAPIKWALEKAGQKVVCWAGLSWTDEGQSSLLMNGDDTLILGGHSVDPGDVIWIRRPEAACPQSQGLRSRQKICLARIPLLLSFHRLFL